MNMRTMRHPATGGVALTTEDAFAAVWASKGWVLDGADEAPVAEPEPAPMQDDTTVSNESETPEEET